MVLRDEQADILGGPILQRPESGVLATLSQFHLVFKSATLLGLGLLVWIACTRGLEHLKKHRELRYRKAMRRKHGIPDSDCRPFAVAYAAAKHARLEREAQHRRKTTNYVSDHTPPAVDQRTNAQKDACILRKRVPETTVQLHGYHLPEKHAAMCDNKRLEAHALDFADRYNPNQRHREAIPEPLLVERLPIHRTRRKEPVINIIDNDESRKRSFEDESDVEHETIKKSRIDGDEQADWYAQYSDGASQRPSKESLGRQIEANHVHMNGQGSSKRVDDLRNEDHEPDEAMEGIYEDEVTELRTVARGKKRDRTEAGSTFGGDDEEDVWNGRALHHRKRRTISRKRIEIPARGQKRDREVESLESEGEGVDSEASERHAQRSSKKQKGKKAVSDEVSGTMVKDPRVSKDPLCGGRRIGDRWEVDGVQYKVGEKGERLRLTLVKKARNKYHMPQDSQHPDRSASLEIYVETWMTEEQCKEAEIGHWQETPKGSNGSMTPEILDSPTKNGKSLLWDSVKCSPARRPFIPPGFSTQMNPFEQRQSQSILGRRVASSGAIASPILPGGADSRTRPGFRGFSKWEKQDREAEAMARIRAKIEEQKKAQLVAQKSAEIPTSVTAPELGTKPLSIPTITVTPAPAVTSEGKTDDSTQQSKSNTSAFPFTAPSSTGDPVAGTAAASSSITPGFSLSSSCTPAITPSALFPSAPTAPTTTSSTGSLSPFSFAKPMQIPSSTSTAAPSSNIFGKRAGAGAPPLPPMLGGTTQSQPPSTVIASKPVPFSFTKPDNSSSPAAVALPTTKSQASTIFNATSGPSLSPVTFGFTPAATKVETPVLPPVLASATTSESSKPIGPLFSFSGASSSPSAATRPTSPAPSAPKFSFGQPSATSTLAPGPNPAPGTSSQPKPTFKFGQTPPTVSDGTCVASAADESKKLTMPVSAFGTAASSNQPAKPSPFGSPSAFGSSTFTSASATNLFGRSGAVDSNSSTSTPPNPTLAPPSVTPSDTMISSTPVGAPATSSMPVFSFGGANSSSKSAEGSHSLFGGAAAGSNATAMFGGNKETPKSASTFGGPTETPKPASVFGGTAEGSKPTFTFGGTAENKPTSGLAAESSKPMSHFPTGSDSSKPSNTLDPSKPTHNPESTTFGAFSPGSPFTFGKDDAATHSSTPMNTQTKPAASFTFGIPSGATGPMFGQPSVFATSGNSSQPVFGKPTNATPSAFGFTGTAGSSSSATFTFGKPAAQNQKQEQ